MNENLFRRILSSKPPIEEIEVRSDRARRRAFAALDEPAAAGGRRRLWLPAFAAGAGVVALAALLYSPLQRRLAPPQESAASSRTHAQTVRVYLTLSDGTKVVWVVDDHFRM